MLIQRGYKTEISPNNKQKTLLAKNAGAARFAFNWALNRIKEGISKPNAIQLHKEWNVWKKENINWWKQVSKCSPQEALRNCDTAFNNFFRRCKERQKRISTIQIKEIWFRQFPSHRNNQSSK